MDVKRLYHRLIRQAFGQTYTIVEGLLEIFHRLLK